MRLERRKALLLSAAAVIAILAILALTLARKVAHLSGNPARPDVPRFQYVGQALRQADYEALGSKPGWRLSVIDRGGGMVLRGLERRAANPASPWILFFEGNSAHLLEEAQRFLDALVDGRDWSAAAWAYRGYDGSGGRPDFASLVSDGWQEYEGLMAEERIDRSRIHLVGFSLGTSVAVAIAARAGVQSPASLTLLAPMTELDMITGKLSRLDRYETLKYLDAIAGPALVIHGGRDVTLPVEGGRLVATRLGARAQYVEPPERAHLDLPLAPEVLDDVRAFISSRTR